MNVYVASSIKNKKEVQAIFDKIRNAGHSIQRTGLKQMIFQKVKKIRKNNMYKRWLNVISKASGRVRGSLLGAPPLPTSPGGIANYPTALLCREPDISESG